MATDGIKDRVDIDTLLERGGRKNSFTSKHMGCDLQGSQAPIKLSL